MPYLPTVFRPKGHLHRNTDLDLENELFFIYGLISVIQRIEASNLIAFVLLKQLQNEYVYSVRW